MQKILLTALFAICSSMFVRAQTLYMPRDVKQAFKKNTRSPDGKPGKNYWQNFGRYDITLTAMPPNRTVKGEEHIIYINNSPDTLKELAIKMFLNIHKPGATRYNDVGQDYLTDGIQIDAFSVNSTEQEWLGQGFNATVQDVVLPQPLLPHDSVKLSFTWHYEISLQSNREGMIDSTTYYLAYFYPRVAVYDDYNGWDRFDFTDQQEFYNDFNNYTITVNVPKNYIVWSTGVLQNANEVLQPKYAQRLASSMQSDEIITIASKEDLTTKNVTAQNAVNTWKWKADYVPDIALNISDHYVWDASSVVVDEATKRRASIQSAYNDTAKDFHYATKFGRHSLNWFSRNWPGVPYPYPVMNIVQGYADMEYPMMINDGTTGDTIFTRFVAEHEIAHTYFPFYMGINETRYAFMDEGWATALEFLIGVADLGKERAESFFKRFRVNDWIFDPSADEDLPIITPSNILRNQSYGNNAYGKPALGYLAMKDMLGDELFKKCLQGYMDRWNGKHPIPWDFFNSFNNLSGQDLNWFWANWYFTNNYIDISLQNVAAIEKGYKCTVENIGGLPIPFDAEVAYDDNTKETFHQTPAVWANNQLQTSISINTKKKVKSISLKTGIYVDYDVTNNTWKAK